MVKIRLLIALTPFILTACGGGGGSASDAGSSTTSTGSGARTVSAQTAVDRNINDFINTISASQSSAADTNLTGIWIEAAGDIRTENGVVNGRSMTRDAVDTIYHVHFVMDNGSSVDVSDCSTALTLYTFHHDASGNLLWSNFKGDTKPVGTISNNKQIDFGTTTYTGSKITSTSDVDFSGDYTSRWIKLNTSFQASIGKLSGSGIQKNIACANLMTSSGTQDGDDTNSYRALFRDSNADWLSSDSTSNSDAPSRSGKTFTLYADGVKVKFSLN